MIELKKAPRAAATLPRPGHTVALPPAPERPAAPRVRWTRLPGIEEGWREVLPDGRIDDEC
jgi:hypothetical protein